MVLGRKDKQPEKVVLIDPVSGNEANTPSEIKRISLEYCHNLLTKKDINENYQEEIEEKRKLHFERLNENIEDDLEELPLATFHKTFDLLSKKPGGKYRFITEAGYSLKKALMKLFQVVWRTESLPEAWRDSRVIQLKQDQRSQKVTPGPKRGKEEE